MCKSVVQETSNMEKIETRKYIKELLASTPFLYAVLVFSHVVVNEGNIEHSLTGIESQAGNRVSFTCKKMTYEILIPLSKILLLIWSTAVYILYYVQPLRAGVGDDP